MNFYLVGLSIVFWCYCCSYYGVEGGKVAGKSQPEPLWKTLDGRPTIFFAHRGEKALIPEHTLPAYRVSAILGAEIIEPDLCLTKDDQFVCHHDLYLRDTTDVADHPEFDHLKRRMKDGSYNWFIRDFTLSELRRLRIRQERIGIRPTEFDGLFKIPTLQEFLNVVMDVGVKLNKTFGIAPELKDPSYHNDGKSPNFMESQLLEELRRNGYPESCTYGKEPVKCPKVVIQSFERPALEYLRNQSKYELLMLADDNLTLLTRQGMEEVSKFANYYCIWKEYLHVGVETYLKFIKKSWDPAQVKGMGGFVEGKSFARIAHELGMKMVVYTVYDSREPSRRGCAYWGKGPKCNEVRAGDKKEELDSLFALGVDGVFLENVAEGREIRREFEYKAQGSGVKSGVGGIWERIHFGSASGAVILMIICSFIL